MPPGVRTGVDQSQHVGRQPETIVEVGVAGKVEHRSSALCPEPRSPRFNRVRTKPHCAKLGRSGAVGIIVVRLLAKRVPSSPSATSSHQSSASNRGNLTARCLTTSASEVHYKAVRFYRG